ncbi:MAG: hypothetical protein GVY19_00560 [Bacteroidetes bacterium]|jgi:hypothetical protein|nr:hypothetical protein [Bacteroidota bacterium]
MKTQKQIAIFILLVFTLPVIYQPLHRLQHATMVPVHESCNKDHGQHHCIKYQTSSNSPSGWYASKDENPSCLLCEVKFTANQMPSIYQPGKIFNDLSEHLNIFVKEPPVYSFVSCKSARAPPIPWLS